MNLTVHTRDKAGKGALNRMRREKHIPAVLYGRGYNPKLVEVEARAMAKAVLSGAAESQLIDLVVEGPAGNSTEKALIKDIQRHPVTESIEHVDFYRVVMTEKLEVDVPVVLTGTPVGIKKGGVLEKRLGRLRVRCLPDRIPEKFAIDVTGLDIAQNLHVSNIVAPEGVTIITDPTYVVAVVTEIKIEEVAAPTAAAAEGAVPAEGAAAEGAAAAPAEGDKKEGAKEAAPKGAGSKGK